MDNIKKDAPPFDAAVFKVMEATILDAFRLGAKAALETMVRLNSTSLDQIGASDPDSGLAGKMFPRVEPEIRNRLMAEMSKTVDKYAYWMPAFYKWLAERHRDQFVNWMLTECDETRRIQQMET